MGKGTLETRLTVLAALRKADGQAARRELKVSTKELARRLDSLNHAHDQMVADRTLFLRADVYEKSEDLHRQEMGRQADRIGVLETCVTQVATVGAIAVLLVTILSRPRSRRDFA